MRADVEATRNGGRRGGRPARQPTWRNARPVWRETLPAVGGRRSGCRSGRKVMVKREGRKENNKKNEK